MSNDSQKTRAEARTDEAVAASGFEDPRATLRRRLKHLKDNQPAAFTKAIEYYEQDLLPRIAEGADPLAEWLDYGRQLGDLTSPGRTMSVDESGRAQPFRSGLTQQTLVLHIPHDTSVDVLALAIPCEQSPAQRATLDLLVNRAREL
jgi:hypothetical protein